MKYATVSARVGVATFLKARNLGKVEYVMQVGKRLGYGRMKRCEKTVV